MRSMLVLCVALVGAIVAPGAGATEPSRPAPSAGDTAAGFAVAVLPMSLSGLEKDAESGVRARLENELATMGLRLIFLPQRMEPKKGCLETPACVRSLVKDPKVAGLLSLQLVRFGPSVQVTVRVLRADTGAEMRRGTSSVDAAAFPGAWNVRQDIGDMLATLRGRPQPEGSGSAAQRETTPTGSSAPTGTPPAAAGSGNPTAASSGTPTATSQARPAGSSRSTPLLIGALAVLAAGASFNVVGMVLHGQAADKHEVYGALTSQNTAAEFDEAWSQYQSKQNLSSTMNIVAYSLYGVGAGLAVWWLVTPSNNVRVAASVAPAPGGATFTLGGIW